MVEEEKEEKVVRSFADYPIISAPGVKPERRMYVPNGMTPSAYLAMIEQSKRMAERFVALYEDPDIFSLRSEVVMARLVVENTLSAVARHHAKTGIMPAEATSALLGLMREVADLVGKAVAVENARSPEERLLAAAERAMQTTVNVQTNVGLPESPVEDREVRFRLIERGEDGAPSLASEERVLKAKIAELTKAVSNSNGTNNNNNNSGGTNGNHVATG